MTKLLKIFRKLLICIIIVWLIMFIFDYGCCSSLKPPIFVIAGENVDVKGNGTYYGLGYTVNIDYTDTDTDRDVSVLSVDMQVFGKVIAASTQ